MDKIHIITFLILIFSFTVVSAQQEDIRFYHERSTNLTIYEKCRIDGAVCDATFTCRLTILTPSQTLAVDNETMLDGGVYWNFTLNDTNTSVNGVYEATIDCSNSTDAGSDTFFYQITPDGSAPIDQGQGLILLGSIILLTIISLFFGFLGFRSKNVTIMLSFLSFSLLIIIFTLGLIVNVVELSFGTYGGIIGNYSTIFTLFTVLLSIGGIGLLLYLVYVALLYYWNLRGMTDTVSIGTN